jgi:hypothetical protein
MASNLTNITVNGVALATLLAVAEKVAVGTHHAKEVAAQRFLVAHTRHLISKQRRSSSRSGRGRIVYQRQEAFYGS